MKYLIIGYLCEGIHFYLLLIRLLSCRPMSWMWIMICGGCTLHATNAVKKLEMGNMFFNK